jgi:Ca-activated chloride channel family protein
MDSFINNFHFMRPQWLLALLALAPLLWMLARRGRGGGAWQDIVDPHLLPHLLVRKSDAGGRLPLVLLGLGWLLLVLALAGPTWTRLPQPVYQTQLYRVLVLDISASMNAPDLAPSRLAQARFEVLDLLRRSEEGQTALIAYGAEPYVVSPLTGDADTIALQVPSLDTGLLPLPGKQAGPALSKALELLQQAGARDGQVILISDGLKDPAAAQEAANALRRAGHRLYVLAVGTPRGAPVPAPDGGFLKDESGAILLPQLHAGPLRELARTGGGHLVQSRPDDRDLESLVAEAQPDLMTDKQKETAEADQWREEGPWLLLVLLPLAALAFRRGWLSPLLLVLLIQPPQAAHAFGWEDLWARPDQQGARALAQDRPGDAARLFENPSWRAAAYYRAEDYEKALEDLKGRQGSEANYNRGNTLARLGRLEEAIKAYDETLEQNPEHEDARYNKQLLEQLLQRNHQQQQSAEQDEPNDDGESENSQDSQGQNAQSDKNEQQQQGGDPKDSNQQMSADQQQPESGKNETQDTSNATEQDMDETPSEAGQTQPEANDPGNQSGEQPTQQDQVAKESKENNRHPGRDDLLGEQDKLASSKQEGIPQPTDEPKVPETTQAMDQWLRRVPDDPAGLLRQRFLLQHLRNRGELP